MTKAELQQRVDILGQLLFEAVHLLRTEDTSDEDRTEQVEEFLYKCQKEGMV
jgi:TfoX/Sxy family transcriptional regulator of competence genes